MQKSKIKLDLTNFKFWVFLTGFTSIVFIILATYGNFEKLDVYGNSPHKNKYGHYDSYVVTREFDKDIPNVDRLSRVAGISRTFTAQKIICSLIAIVTGSTCLVLAIEEEKFSDIRDYKTVKEIEVHKFEIDTQVAAHNKIGSEKTIVVAYDLSSELMKNPIYAEYMRRKQQTLENAGTQEEEDESRKEEKGLWGSFVEDEDEIEPQTSTDKAKDSKQSKFILSESQIKEIIRLNRQEFIALGKAITQVTGISPEHQEFAQIREELVRRLTGK